MRIRQVSATNAFLAAVAVVGIVRTLVLYLQDRCPPNMTVVLLLTAAGVAALALAKEA